MFRVSSAVRRDRYCFWFHQLRFMSSSLLQSKAFVDGQWVNASSGDTFPVVNPANGQVIGHVPNMNKEDAEKAITAANRAFRSPEWSTLTGKQRSLLLKVSLNVQSLYKLTNNNKKNKINIFILRNGIN